MFQVVLYPPRGTYRHRHDTLGAGCDGRSTLNGEWASCGRRSRVVLASIRPACAGAATVTIKAAHRGEHEVSRKTIALGKPGCFGCTCQTRVHSFSASAH